MGSEMCIRDRTYSENLSDRLLVLIEPDGEDNTEFRYVFAARTTLEGEFVAPITFAEIVGDVFLYGSSNSMKLTVASD